MTFSGPAYGTTCAFLALDDASAEAADTGATCPTHLTPPLAAPGVAQTKSGQAERAKARKARKA